MSLFLDIPSNLHPYECDGPGSCLHCDRLVTPNHDPETCALCADEEETMTAIQDAASKVQEIAAAIGAVDLEQEKQQITDGLAGIQQELFALADTLRGIEPGEETPEPSGSENVDAAPEEGEEGA
jgi:cob(I)alamin adenosyltransferase